ncbi:hypothetical protein [Bifidobacterium choloepi]|uniref:Uncharacterized protein n=1 Tax=Bifidobacterium choloepi TaxID=2614131 RepID=A0A6I5N2P1_9BIFI|nr:hypothetical protein [Bifidobacterium choloepi]NEG70445.1 hypothetical protein [Bifidobacterium choloepi]
MATHEEFEEIREKLAEERDDFEKKGNDVIDKMKDAKEGWEDSHAEDNFKQEIATKEETHQTH